MQKTALFQYNSNPYSQSITATLCKHPFGMLIKERAYSSNSYRFGFNGMEKDDEIKGSGNSYAFEYRIHDPRLGRFLSVDPLSASYPWNSTYAFAENDVISCMDLEGLERFYSTTGKFLGQIGSSGTIYIVDKNNTSAAVEQIKALENKPRPFNLNDQYIYNNLITKSSVIYSKATLQAQANVSMAIAKEIIKSRKFRLFAKRNSPNNASWSNEAVDMFSVYPLVTKDGEFVNDNYYNQINSAYHEEIHNQKRVSNEKDGELEHFDIFYAATDHYSWDHTTEAYKKDVQRSMLIGLKNSGSLLHGNIFMSTDKKSLVNSEEFKSKVTNYEDQIKKYQELFGTTETPEIYESLKNKIKDVQNE